MSFTQNLTWRYATKKFDGKKIPQKDFETIQNAIQFAPSSFGLQPYHITIVENPTLRQALETSSGQKQFTTASHVFVFSARTDIMERVVQHVENNAIVQNEKREDLASYEKMLTDSMSSKKGDELKAWCAKQAYIALGFGLAACAELKIDACPMEGFDKNEFKKILNLPDNFYPQACLGIGYRAGDENPRPKVRFSLEDLFDTK